MSGGFRFPDAAGGEEGAAGGAAFQNEADDDE